MGNNISATSEEPIRNKINNKKYIDINNVVIDEKLKVINLAYSNGVVVRYARDGRKLDDGRTLLVIMQMIQIYMWKCLY